MSEQINRKDCIKVRDAWEQIGVSNSTFYAYMSHLQIKTHKFKFDMNSYITKTDFERIKEMKGIS